MICFFLNLLVLAAAPSSADTDELQRESVYQRAKEIMEHPSYQKELVQEETSQSYTVSGDWGGGSFGRLLFYLGMVLAVLFVLIWLWDHLRMREGETDPNAPAPGSADRADGRDPSLAEAQKLADGGRFDEAVHILLLCAVKRLAALRKNPTPHEMTCRELVRVLPRTEKERDRFRHLVKVVELSLFGGRTVNRASFLDCVQKYKGLGL